MGIVKKKFIIYEIGFGGMIMLADCYNNGDPLLTEEEAVEFTFNSQEVGRFKKDILVSIVPVYYRDSIKTEPWGV